MLPTPAPTTPGNSPHLQSSRLPQTEVPDFNLSHNAYPEAPPNRGTAPFSVLSGLFDRLQNERKPEKRRRFLSAWFDHWHKEVGHDLYPVLRLLLPQKDRERAIYGLKEKNIAKTYIKMIPLGPKDPDAIRLLDWRKPSGPNRSSGDFPTVLFEVVAKRSSVIEGSLTIDELNTALDDLSRNISKGDVQSKIMQRIYNRATPEEQRWIVRIILKDIGISVKETTVFSVFHPDAHDLFNTCSDLKKVAWELWDPERRLNDQDKSIQLFRAFAPMLCKRPTGNIEESVKDMEGRAFLLEEKLDGERIQLHKRGNEYLYCSRKGKDYTYLYGSHVGTGSLTPYIDKAFDRRIDNIILDGEMLVWDPVSERNRPFGTLKSAALDKSKGNLNPRPCFKVFDLLYLNGQSLINKSTKFRKRNLKACIKDIQGRIELVADFEARTAKDVRKKMEDIMATRGEGLVMKHPDAVYTLNGRNKDWIKVKPEYMDNMGETVDALVVAGNYGSGKRGGGVSTLICAVLDDRDTAQADDEPKYSTFVRIGSGLSYADYVWIRGLPWKEWSTKNPPEFLSTASGSRDDKGDLYLEPEDSFIIQIKAAEILPTEQFHLGFTMRFPRALSVRENLSVSDCITASAILESVRSEKKRKMENVAEKSGKKKRKTIAKPSVLPEYRGVDLKDVQIESSLFEGLIFVVASDPKSRTRDADKEQLLKLIRAHGGASAQVAKNQSGLLVVYGGSTTPYDIKLIMNKGVFDIIRPQWLLDSIANNELAPMSKRYFFHATAERMESEEYYNEDDGPEGLPEETSSRMMVPPSIQVDAGGSESKEEDSEMQDWLKIEPDSNFAENSIDEADSVTDPDSDNEDNWFTIDAPQPDGGEVSRTELDSNQDEDEQVNVEGTKHAHMGEDTAMEYDQERIFRHLCFYLDTPFNARNNGMSVTSRHEDAIARSFERIAKLIEENGGQIANLDDEKLTHVVIDKRDDSRRRELMKRTSKPKHRNIVLSDFIEACIEENTLLNEADFMP
ncbi:DNA ligase 4 [Russula brevipes]|nr:DNA ligase 4 [Russula brevipes]